MPYDFSVYCIINESKNYDYVMGGVMIEARDVILIVLGVVIGVIGDTVLGTPLKYLISGQWIEKRNIKRREILKSEIYETLKNSKEKLLNTKFFYEKYKYEFKFMSCFEMYKLIEEMENDGRVRKLVVDGSTYDDQFWISN